MAQDKKLTRQKLSDLWGDRNVKTLNTAGEKYVIMSDLHMGDGGNADDFRHNPKALMRALDSYRTDGYTLILLGDVEELWQFDLHQIEATYDTDIYERIRAFDPNRVFRVFGNHDIDWSLRDPIRKDTGRATSIHEALKLADKRGKVRVLLVHGHQGSVESDKNSWFSRFVVRGLFKPVEHVATKLGLYGHPSATKSQVATDYERILYSWARDKKVILICGHSHRAIYAAKTYVDKLQSMIAELQAENLKPGTAREQIEKNIKKIYKLNNKLMKEQLKGRDIDPVETNREPLPCYFNSGCALYTDGITVLEIADDKISLVKWHNKPKKQEYKVVFDDGNGKTLTDFINQVIA